MDDHTNGLIVKKEGPVSRPLGSCKLIPYGVGLLFHIRYPFHVSCLIVFDTFLNRLAQWLKSCPCKWNASPHRRAYWSNSWCGCFPQGLPDGSKGTKAIYGRASFWSFPWNWPLFLPWTNWNPYLRTVWNAPLGLPIRCCSWTVRWQGPPFHPCLRAPSDRYSQSSGSSPPLHWTGGCPYGPLFVFLFLPDSRILVKQYSSSNRAVDKILEWRGNGKSADCISWVASATALYPSSEKLCELNFL